MMKSKKKNTKERGNKLKGRKKVKQQIKFMYNEYLII